MDVNQLAAAGFFFKSWSDAVCCAFCGLEVGQWNKGGDGFKDHERWSPFCEFSKVFFAGNIPSQPETSQQKPNISYDVCGPYMKYTPKASRPERCNYIFTFIYLLPPMYTTCLLSQFSNKSQCG